MTNGLHVRALLSLSKSAVVAETFKAKEIESIEVTDVIKEMRNNYLRMLDHKGPFVYFTYGRGLRI